MALNMWDKNQDKSEQNKFNFSLHFLLYVINLFFFSINYGINQ